MPEWACAVQGRDQLVLFSERHDQAIAADHPVRLVDQILAGAGWSDFEAEYATASSRGRRPYHPRTTRRTHSH